MNPSVGRRGATLGLAAAWLARGPSCLAAAGGPLSAPPSGPLSGPLSAPLAESAAEIGWHVFANRYMAPEGRIVDTGNNGVSHSEGQGWAMLCAVRFDDRARFDRLWSWTARHLRRPGDRLFAWRWRPAVPNPVEDQNNALDGDLFIAAALLLAARQWEEPALAREGEAMAQDLLRLCLRQAGPWLVLLPGAHGFEKREEVVINPSYYAFPALRVLATALPDQVWLRLVRDGLSLLRVGRFGRWGLPPDWLSLSKIDGRPGLPRSWPPRFSYDAVRVPLYMAWAGMGEEPAVQSAIAFWQAAHTQLPAWVDLTTDRVANYAAPAGTRAIAFFARMAQNAPLSGERLPLVESAGDYYSSVLCLLSGVALRDIEQRRF